MVVRLKGQRYEKRQSVTVQLSSCPIRVSYEPDVRRVGPRKGEDEKVTQAMWLLKVEVLDSRMESWYLLIDWTCNTSAQAARLFQMYRQRWSVEEAFQFLKTCVGWGEVQVLDLEAVRTLVALGWVAAGFLYEIDGEWEWVDVELLAKLGGFEPHKGRKPGKKILLWGLQRVLDYMVTEAILRRHKAATGSIPPGVAALLGKDIVDQL
ncbi:MAG: transposase [Chloroflexi bacterium]|nr:transposase [Chloroflexota bacterium]